MGIRLQKAIGWAITDLAPNDPRINQAAVDAASDEPGPVWDRYRALIEADQADGDAIAELALYAIEDSGTPDLDRCILSVLGDGEHPDEKVALLVLPPAYATEWHRSDDQIDYELALLDDEVDQTPTTIRPLQHAPFPFSGWMDAVTGERLYGSADGFLQSFRKGQLDAAAALLTMVRSSVTRAVAYEDLAVARERIVPVVPSPVRRLAEAAGVLTAPDGWLRLRPVLASWWA